MGALIYYVAEPPASDFDIAQMLRSFSFVNAWHPDWIPTTSGWMVVPGGWSIGVEFTFYALFPLLAAIVTTLHRALLFTAAALLCAILANRAAAVWLVGYEPAAVGNFLYFWFPNQLPVFALGFVLYFVLNRYPLPVLSRTTSYGLLAVIGVVWLGAAEWPSRCSRFDSLSFAPTILVASLSFMAFIFVLAKGADTVFAHPWIRRLGVLSFSSYVLHFLFVHQLPAWTGGLIDITATGYSAIGMGIALWVLTMICTTATAALAYRLIEQPGIDLARYLTWSRSSPKGYTGSWLFVR